MMSVAKTKSKKYHHPPHAKLKTPMTTPKIAESMILLLKDLVSKASRKTHTAMSGKIMFHMSVSEPRVLERNMGLNASIIAAKNPAVVFIIFLPIKKAAMAAITARKVGKKNEACIRLTLESSRCMNL